MTWWQRLWHRDRFEHQLEAELRFHFDRLVDDNMRAGMSRDEARRAARLEFGGLEQMKEECRDARATRWAHDLVQDVRFAARLLTKDRGFTGIAVMALALGIGVNSMFFTIVNAMCLRGPLRDPAGLVHIGTRDAAGMPGGVSHADFTDIQDVVRRHRVGGDGGRTLQSLAAYAAVPVALGDERVAPERVTGAYTSAAVFRIIGETALLGRDFAPQDDRAGASPVAIMAAGLWKRRYAADAGIVGRTIRVDGVPTVVIGIMREGFRFPNDAEIWLPLASMAGLSTQPRSARTLGIVGGVAGNGEIAGVQAELDAIAARLEQAHPRTHAGTRMTVVPINDRFTSRITDPAWMAFITAGTLVLLIACANVANLLLGRAVRRSGEMAIRTSLGASRTRIVRQLLVECGLLAAVGGSVGVLLSLAGARVMSAAIPQGALPSWMELTMDARVLATLAAVCLATVFVFGFVPALHTSRTSVTHVTRDQRHVRVVGAGARRWTTAFLTLQFALTFVMLGTLVGSLRALRDSDEPVIDPANVLTTWVTLPAGKYGEPSDRARFYDRLLQETRATVNVTSATVATGLPFGGASQRRVEVAGRESTRTEAASMVGTVSIGVGYFTTFGTGVVQGRDFTESDGTPGRDSVIVNRRFAQLYFPNGDTLGQRIRLLPQNASADALPWLTIVGISPDIPHGGPGQVPVTYRPFAATFPPTATLVVRSPAEGSALAAALRDLVRNLDPDVPLYRTLAMRRVVSDSGWNPRISSAIINTISTIALVLAVVGLYGVTVHSVAARAREIGIRLALGAKPRHVRWLVLRGALFQLALGVPAGVALTVAWNSFFGSPSESGTAMERLGHLAVVATVMIGVGVAACLLPARRAVHLDPLATLRQE